MRKNDIIFMDSANIKGSTAFTAGEIITLNLEIEYAEGVDGRYEVILIDEKKDTKEVLLSGTLSKITRISTLDLPPNENYLLRMFFDIGLEAPQIENMLITLKA